MEKRECVEFIYGGCAGNSNNFESKEDCELKCMKKAEEAVDSTTVIAEKMEKEEDKSDATSIPNADAVTEQTVSS